ncbi:hypothetical protein [uncultured Veillonella sp.]|uniref:hypothetical protein n=1 Tax=uncultured Veillonella sp. TaxID=159268 RepID=UPI0026703C4A|nr:hypothetical protein [uncultured Veillonella sp.]
MSAEGIQNDNLISQIDTLNDSDLNQSEDFDDTAQQLYNAFRALIIQSGSLEELKTLKALIELHKVDLYTGLYERLRTMIIRKIYKYL